MKLTSKQFTDICADVSADNVDEAMRVSKVMGSDKGMTVATLKLLLDVSFCQRLEKLLGITDEDGGVEVTKGAYDDAVNQMVKDVEKNASNEKEKLIHSLEALVYTARLRERLFGKENEDEADNN